MKKYFAILLIVFLTTTLVLNAQQRSGSRSTSSSRKSSTSVRTSKPARSSRQAVSQARSSSVQRKAVQTRPATRKSTPSVRTVQRSNSSRSTSSAVRAITRSSSSVRNRETPNRQYSSRSPVDKGSSSQTRTAAPTRNATPSRSPDQKSLENISRPVIRNPIPGKPNAYRSTRKFRFERPIRYHYRFAPYPRHYRARYFPYRRPIFVHFYWSINVYHHWCALYPVIQYWDYYPDYNVSTISAYDALFHIGEIRRVYGKVSEVYFETETDEYFLYIGAYYPYHDFTVVIPGEIARRFSRNPEFYFDSEHIEVTGLITEYEEKPEIVVKEKKQLKRY
ncbi:MAG: hypothetical protein JSV24_04015 [Bacteroidales bacterium]|nr:MAG: hypothetical protein JSV24_04015 [Bacteroidales bacterium]